MLVGCGGGYPTPALPILHLAHVSQIPGVDSLHKQENPGGIDLIATYQPSGGASARVLFARDGDTYDVGLDGSNLHKVDLGCGGAGSVTVDGRLLVCDGAGSSGTRGFGFIITSPAAPTSSVLATSDVENGVTTTPAQWRDPTWVDNGHLLAAIKTDLTCAFALVTVSAAPVKLELRAVLRLPESLLDAAPGSPCDLAAVSASSDGSWLAFMNKPVESFQSWAIYALPLSSILAQLPPAGHRPVTLAVQADQIVRLGPTDNPTSLSWSNGADGWMLTFISGDTIVRASPLTGRQTTVLGVKASAVAWTPDGSQLVFVQTQYTACGDCGPPPFPASRLYIYTPAA
jgi:hypothetical protein